MWGWVAMGGWTATALAGSGPWTVGEGRGSLYVGADAERFGRLGITEQDEPLDVGEGVQKLGVKAIATVGVSRRFELELGVPWQRVDATRPDAELCGALGLGACQTTRGIGVVTSNAKVLVLDEYFGAPLSLALVGEVRLGQLTAPDRERITNLGEGTLDVGPHLVVGRSAGVGGGSLAAWAEVGYRFRTRNTDDYPLADPKKNVAAPRDEVTSSAQVLAGGSRVLVGPQAYLLYRPGLAFGALDLADDDRFAALGVTNLKAGGVLVVRGPQHLTAAVSFLGTALAVNNPTDSWNVGFGLQWDTALPGGG